MTDIRSAMPVLARHEGIWEGCYRHFDAQGTLIDIHRSRLICRFPSDGPYPYHQTNIYHWDDGRTETRDFPATYRDGRIWWDNDLISGWAADVSLDPHQRTVMLYWIRKGMPDTYLYEMVQLSDCGNCRSRVWQWIESGQLKMRTLIDETRVPS
jgi:hypothetical protein